MNDYLFLIGPAFFLPSDHLKRDDIEEFRYSTGFDLWIALRKDHSHSVLSAFRWIKKHALSLPFDRGVIAYWRRDKR